MHIAMAHQRLARLAQKMGLDVATMRTMFKGSLAPTIGIAMYQAPLVADYFTNLGYLVPIASVIALPVLPRGKFLQTLLLNLGAVCVGGAAAMLMLWSSVQARLHTTAPADGSSEDAGSSEHADVVYNSSASAVCAVWLFANIWAVNFLRAKLPSFNLPAILYSLMANVAATLGPRLPTTEAAKAFVCQLLTAMLTGLAVAAAVHVLVLPLSSRDVLMGEFAAASGLIRRAVAQEREYLTALESDDMFAPVMTRSTTDGHQQRLTKEARAARTMAATVQQLHELVGKMQADVTFAGREVAWGKLSAHHLSQIYTLMRDVLIPVAGIASLADIFQRVAERRGWDVMDGPDDAEKAREREEWNEIMGQMRKPFAVLSQAVDQGLLHASICLELVRPEKRDRLDDVEAGGRVADHDQDVRPGEKDFAKTVDDKVRVFAAMKTELLRTWVARRREQAGQDAASQDAGVEEDADAAFRRERHQAQLYVALYVETLMQAAGEATQALMSFADARVADGTMTRRRGRLMVPTWERTRTWVAGVFGRRGGGGGGGGGEDLDEATITCAEAGHYHDFTRQRNPEHLPPVNALERIGDGVRRLSGLLGSAESMFGVRVACATMTVGIVAFLESTQVFFVQQRLVWAMFIIAIGMTMTSGQSFFGLLGRTAGTFVAMCLSLLVWYIAVGHPTGVIVLLWLSMLACHYFFVKMPRILPIIVITIITQLLIIGYELQVAVLGEAAAERSGQRYYPTYLLAPYRLACVAGGGLVAFFWTVFPSPLTDRAGLRRDLASCAALLARYFAAIHATLQASIFHEGERHGVDAANRRRLDRHRRHLARARIAMFAELMGLLPSAAQHATSQRWEPTVGGKFPRQVYEDMVQRAQRITSYLTLMSYTLTHPPRDHDDDDDDDDGDDDHDDDNDDDHDDDNDDNETDDHGKWDEALATVLATVEPTHHTILSSLALVSHALASGRALPPYTPLPRPYQMARPTGLGRGSVLPGMLGVGLDVLDPRNMHRPGYARFAVAQVCVMLVCDDLEGLVGSVKALVGVVDYGFRVDGDDHVVAAAGDGKHVSST